MSFLGKPLGKIILKRKYALGDTILVTPFIPHLKRFNHLTFNGAYSHVIKDQVDSVEEPRNYKWRYYESIINLDKAYETRPNLHILEAYAEVIKSHGYEVPNIKFAKPRIRSEPVDQLFQYKKPPKRYVVLHLGGTGWKSKRVDTRVFKEFAIKLKKEFRVQIVVVGSAVDRTVAGIVDYDLIGQTNVHQMKTLIEGAALFIGVDSAPYHVASCTDTPQVGLFTVVDGNLIKPLHKETLVINSNASCMGCLKRLPPPVEAHFCVSERPFHCISDFDPLSVYQQVSQIKSFQDALLLPQNRLP